MDDRRSPSYNIGVGMLSFVCFVLLFGAVGWGYLKAGEQAIKLPLLMILGVMALLATLALVAVAFSVADLSDETQALGLPEGSVRAVIALSLIVILAIFSIYLYSSLASPDASKANPAAADFAKQVFAVVSTLMTSVASFYFASRAAASMTGASKSSPKLLAIKPIDASKTKGTFPMDVEISGNDLQLAKGVTFQKTGAATLVATNVVSSNQVVKCQISVGPNQDEGKYDATVTNSDGATATLPQGFDVKA